MAVQQWGAGLYHPGMYRLVPHRAAQLPAWPSEEAAEAARLSPARLAAVLTAKGVVQHALASWGRLNTLACTLLGVPTSFVALVEEHRDGYPSQVGLPDVLGNPAFLTGRTFCHYTVALDEMVVIEDTLSHAFTRAVPTVGSLGIRAYVGVPLRVDGQPYGSFCVADTEPRQWAAVALETLAMMALAAERELSLQLAQQRAETEAARARALTAQCETLMASVAHDLGTPLQLVKLVGWQLRQSASAAQQPLVERLAHAGEAMRQLAGDLVRGRSLEVNGRNVALLSVADVLRSAQAMMAPLAERAGIRLVLAAQPAAQLRGDEAELLRVFANLIGNCLKYTPTGSTVLLQAAVAEPSEVVLSVIDDGPGMSPEDCAQAFIAGWQGANGHQRGDGSGLGLDIVRTLVARNGGTVSLESTLGEGTQVHLRLPRAG